MGFFKIMDELVTRLSAFILTGFLVCLVIWPFGPDGWWDKILKYFAMGTVGVLAYLILPIIYYFFKAMYHERKLNKR